ncbi:unnamed protein product, partial [Oikopleura dioica]
MRTRTHAHSDDGELVFSNQLIASGRKNSFIRLGPETQLDLSCKYDSVYDNITAVTTIDSNNFTGGGTGSGKLKFHVSNSRSQEKMIFFAFCVAKGGQMQCWKT